MGNKVRYIVLIAAVILLIIQLIITDYNNFFKWKNLSPILIPILIIISMWGSILNVNKHGEN